MEIKEMKTWQKIALMIGAVLVLGILIHYGVDAAGSIGFNK